MSLVLPREEEVENMFSRILSSDQYCERLMDAFYDYLCDDKRTTYPDPHHFAEVLLGAYKNGDVSALLLELFTRSMFDLLKETYLVPKRFRGKNGENPVLLTDVDGNLLKDKADLVSRHEMPQGRSFCHKECPCGLGRTHGLVWRKIGMGTGARDKNCRRTGSL